MWAYILSQTQTPGRLLLFGGLSIGGATVLGSMFSDMTTTPPSAQDRRRTLQNLNYDGQVRAPPAETNSVAYACPFAQARAAKAAGRWYHRTGGDARPEPSVATLPCAAHGAGAGAASLFHDQGYGGRAR